MKPDLFIIVTDSARAFDSGSGDDREKPKFYDSLINEGFIHMPYFYTSAPSSVMSGATILTTLDSYMTSKNYDDFRFSSEIKNNYLLSLEEIGYKVFSLFVARELREKIGKMSNAIYKSDKYNCRHSDRMWDNSDLNKILDDKLSETDKNDRLAVIFWNNIRNDKYIDNNLEDLLDIIKKHNRFENSIIMFLSDHGYPTADKGITPEGLKRDKKTHDLWLTDDNIRIPFYIKIPDKRKMNINSNLSTSDLFPTFYDFLGINWYNEFSEAKSMFSSKDILDNRIIRVDSRFYGQPDRKTALIYKDYKFILNHDSKERSLFKLDKDNFSEFPTSNLELMNFLSEEYNKRDIQAANYQYKGILEKYMCNYKRVVVGNSDKYLLNFLDSNFDEIITVDKYINIFNEWPNRDKTIYINLNFRFPIIDVFFKNRVSILLYTYKFPLKWGPLRFFKSIYNIKHFFLMEPRYFFIRIKEYLNF